VVDLKQNSISNHAKIDGLKADCTISIKDEDFIGLASGTANAQQVSNEIKILRLLSYRVFIFFPFLLKMFMKGKLKVKGNIMLAQKLEKLFKTNSKL
jgi:3-hydroxyacyl-CoA dehydrogenase/3a,7a,12a-trihydroxy-5b-cholest-24-enoyl-CoA hydratase